MRNGTVAADVTRAGFNIKFNIHYACAILPAVTLLFHQQIKFVNSVKRCSIFFAVIRKWFEKSEERDAALVLDGFAHNFWYEDTKYQN